MQNRKAIQGKGGAKNLNNLTESVRRTSMAFTLIQDRYNQRHNLSSEQSTADKVDERMA